MSTIGGLPAHVLLVHLVVVLVPLSALLLVLVALVPRVRAQLAVLTAVLAVLALVAVPITTEAGGWLAHRLPRTPLLRAHTHLGDTMLPWAAGLAVVAVLVALHHRRGARSGQASTGAVRLTGIALTVLALVAAVGSVVTVYRIGDSGARAAWTGQFSAQPLPRPADAAHQKP
jgi:hypothetical protein